MDGVMKSSSRSTPLRRAVTPSTIAAPSSTIATPSSRSSALLHTPGTAGSSGIHEPRSEYLRDLLKDRYAASASAPPPQHIPFMGRPSPTPPSSLNKSVATKNGLSGSQNLSGVVDAWMLASADSPLNGSSRRSSKVHGTSSPYDHNLESARAPSMAGTNASNRRSRRANSLSTSGASTTPARALSVRETEVLLDRQSKENFDLKLRLCLQEERIAKLSIELEKAHSKVAETDRLRANLDETEDARSDLGKQLEALESELGHCKTENDKLNSERDEAHRLHEELLAELEKRDAAVNEAVNMIMSLQKELDQLKRSYHVSQDSFGSDAAAGYHSDHLSFYVPPASPDGYHLSNSVTNDPSFQDHSLAYDFHRSGVRSSERLRSSKDRLSLPVQRSYAVPSPRLSSVQPNVASRPSTGAADSEYYSARSSFSPASSSSFLADNPAASHQKLGGRDPRVPRHPQISRIQTAANPPSRTHAIPESRSASNGSSQFTRESPNSASLTCESRDSVETMESLTSASSASMNAKRADDNNARRRSLNPSAVPSHLRNARPGPSVNGHSRSRSAHDIPALTPLQLEPHAQDGVPVMSREQGPYYRQVPASAATPSGRFPDQQKYSQSQNLQRARTHSFHPPQTTHCHPAQTSRPRPTRAMHVSYETDYLEEPKPYSTFPADWEGSQSQYNSVQYGRAQPHHRPAAKVSPEPQFVPKDFNYHADPDHGVPVRPGVDYADAFEVASTVATHEDMAYDSSSSASKFNGPAFDMSSSEDEGEPSLQNADMLPGQMTHGVQLHSDHNPNMNFRNQQPPEPPERRSSNRASFSTGLGPFDPKSGDKDTVKPRDYSHRQSQPHVQFAMPDRLPHSLPSTHDDRTTEQKSKEGPGEQLALAQAQRGPTKSRSRRLTDGPVGFLSFGKFGRKG